MKHSDMSKNHIEIVKNIIVAVKEMHIARNTPIVIALDGRSGAGKSTFSKLLANELNATVIVGDDFYSGGTDAEWRSRTPQEKVEWGFDWRRIRTEVLESLLNNCHAEYHPADLKSGKGLSKKIIKLKPAKVIILEGIYSARQELNDLIHIKVLVQSQDTTRHQRILNREGKRLYEQWLSVWNEAENYYFTQVCPTGMFDFVI